MPKQDDKKKAKTAQKKQQPDELAASQLVMITGEGHKVAKTVDGYAVCGEERLGWRYGEDRHVTCKFCRDGVRKDEYVPPALPEDGDLSSLPVLNIEEFEDANPA